MNPFFTTLSGQSQMMMQQAQQMKAERERRSREGKLQGYLDEGNRALQTSTSAAVSGAMPQFADQLQGIREQAIRRGVTLGDIGTRNEGSLASAFQRNLANATAGQALGTYQTALDRQAGDRDYQTAKDNARAQRRSSLWGSLAGLAGTVLGGPLGGAIGGWLGGKLGGASRVNVPNPALRRLPARSNNTAGGYAAPVGYP